MRNNFFLIINSELIGKVIKNTDEIFLQKLKKTNNLISIWVTSFIFLIFNLFSVFFYLKFNLLLGRSLWVINNLIFYLLQLIYFIIIK